METKSDAAQSPSKKSWLAILGRIVWLLLLVFIGLVGVVFFAVGKDAPSEQKNNALLFLLLLGGAGIFALIVLSLLLSRRFRRFAVFGLICLATLVGLFYAEETWRGKHDWNRLQYELAAKGETTDWQALVPSPVPTEDNFAMTPLVASSYSSMLDANGHEKLPSDTNVVDRLDFTAYLYGGNKDQTPSTGSWEEGKHADLSGWQTFYRNLATKTNSIPVTPQPQTPAKDVLLALSPLDGTLEELRADAKLPQSRFPLEYDKEDPSQILLPHLSAMKQTAMVLKLRTLAELQNQQPEAALADIELSFNLVDAIHSEPFLISHLVRISMAEINLQPVWEGLADHRWPDAQLAELDGQLARINFISDYRQTMHGEVAFMVRNIEYWRKHPKAIGVDVFDPDSPLWHPRQTLSLQWIPSGWFYQNEVSYANIMLNYFIPVADTNTMTLSPAAERTAMKAFDTGRQRLVIYQFLEDWLIPAVEHSPDKFARAQASVDLARVAIALERYRLAQGNYPVALEALSPKYLAAIPHDVINGQPLHYQLDANGRFTLYSVGWNEVDDGGAVVMGTGSGPQVDFNQGDWVWRYPAQ